MATKRAKPRVRKEQTPPGQPLSTTQVWLPTLSDTGQQITPSVAIAFSTVYACVQLLADSVAGLPWCVYRRTERGKEQAAGNPWSWRLMCEPNPDMDSFTFRQVMMVSALLTGNGYAQIHETGLYFLRPDRMTMFRKDGEIVYLYSGTSGGAAFTSREVFHIKALGFDGLMGQSPIALMRNSIGTATGQESFAAGFFRNGARPSGVLTMPGKLDPEAQNRLRSSWESLYAGKQNAGRVAILEQGLDFKPLSIPSDDAQFLESRQFQRVEICSAFRVPPHMIGDQTGSSYSNNEQANTEFVQHTLRSWVTRWEMEFQRKILGQDSNLFSRMSFDDLLRGDMVQRSQFYERMKLIGALSANEIREREDWNNIGPQGDVYSMSQNETPVAQKIAEAKRVTEQPAAETTAEPVADSVDMEPEDEGVDPAYADWATETADRMIRVELNAYTRKRDDWEPREDRFVEAMTPIARSAGVDEHSVRRVCRDLCSWLRETESDLWLATLPVRAADALLGVCHAV